MNYEVEQKFRLDGVTEFVERVESLGGSFQLAIVQSDMYFAHPSRDFAKTDEALRIRSVCDKHWVTYKGPKIDPNTKTRRELELPLATDTKSFAELLAALGFRRVAIVRKTRKSAALKVNGWHFTIDLDQVEGVGSFAELETTAKESQLPEATEAMNSLAEKLELRSAVRTSYLELLLECTANPQTH